MGRVLIAAYHFPPCVGSSGVLRSLKFARYLPEFGWTPTILTARPSAYEEKDIRALASIPENLRVIRSVALDVKRHLGFGGFYQDWLAIPDRWGSWLFTAVAAGIWAIRQEKIDAIFTTFPISTTILIGLLLHKLTGKPWIVDFRDSMTEDNYPPEGFRRRIWTWIERRAMTRASLVLFTAPSTRSMYLARYPHLSSEKFRLISNGYDEEDLAVFDCRRTRQSNPAEPLKLLHSGTLYRGERDPRPFLQALARLKEAGVVNADRLQITLRNPTDDAYYQRLLNELKVDDMVAIRPHLPHRESLAECAESDALLIFQAANCDHQVPAKAYEYMRLGKPILALTTQSGDTAALLNEVGGSTIMNLADEEEICRGLPRFLKALATHSHPLPDQVKMRRYSRRSQAEELASCLSELARKQLLKVSRKKSL